jgi:hypothetical protein
VAEEVSYVVHHHAMRGDYLQVFEKFLWRRCARASCSLGRFWWYVIFLFLSNLEL